MAVMIWRRVYMDNLIPRLEQDYPQLSFTPDHSACWSPRHNQVSYIADGTHAAAGLLHELAHALLMHSHYTSDLDLLQKEVAAWEKARSLASLYHLKLDEDHIQDCLDTYRDWVHKRSTCPTCHINGIQTSTSRYNCLNCMQAWSVSNARLKRPYRLSESHTT